MEDNIQFSNMDNWRGGGDKFGLTFKQIVHLHLNRCVMNGSVEWRGGYWEDKYVHNVHERIYHPDSREVFNNSVKVFRTLLVGYFDKEMKKADTELKEAFKKRKEKHAQRRIELKEKESHGEHVEVKVSEFILKWNAFKTEHYFELLEELVLLSKRLNFFEEESSDDEL